MNQFNELALKTDPALILTRIGKTPDEWQSSVLRARAPQVLLNCTRQGGKSLTVGAMALDEALFYENALVLVLSPSLRQSQESFRTIMGIYHQLGMGTLSPDLESSLRIELPNGNRIIALPGKEATVRGYSAVTLLIIDEAARVADDLYRAVRPMLAVSGGRIVALSTPFGKVGWFFETWTSGEGWERVQITAEQCPRISKAFLESERRSMPRSWFEQEYYCMFSEQEGAVFRSEDIERAFSHDFGPPLFPDLVASEQEHR